MMTCLCSGHILSFSELKMEDSLQSSDSLPCFLVVLDNSKSFSDISHRSINKEQFQRKKNDTLDPELYVAFLNH